MNYATGRDVPRFYKHQLSWADIKNMDFPSSFFKQTFGLELEVNRVETGLKLSSLPHPSGLGDPLSDPHFTKDFLESTLEIVTPPYGSVDEVIRTLDALKSQAQEKLEGEQLWPVSTPPPFDQLTTEHISRFGSSSEALKKHQYYRQLTNKHPVWKAAFTGLHVNVSFSDDFWQRLRALQAPTMPIAEFKDAGYMALVRNLYRVTPLMVYLFGCSPLLPYLRDAYPELAQANEGCADEIVSLRTSTKGFWQCDAYWGLDLNDAQQFVDELGALLEREKLKPEGLQAPGEVYSFIRKRSANSQESDPVMAQKKHGIDYVELRAIDLNPFAPAGVTKEQLVLIEVIMMFCALSDSPAASAEEKQQWRDNIERVSLAGRYGQVSIDQVGGALPFCEWAASIFDELTAMGRWMSDCTENPVYQEAVEQFSPHIANSQLTTANRFYQLVDDHGCWREGVKNLLLC